jgi:signal transduction histidine kinase
MLDWPPAARFGTYSQPKTSTPGESRLSLPGPIPAIVPGNAASGSSRSAGTPWDGTGELAHDARNFLAAIDLYCELLAAPGVLSSRFGHYADDLRTIGRTGARLVARLAGTDERQFAASAPPSLMAPSDPLHAFSGNPFPGHSLPLHSFPVHSFPLIDDLGGELLALKGLLQALAGPEVRLDIECAACAGRIGLNSESLLRVLFNLVANSVEAMHSPSADGDRKSIRITAQYAEGGSFSAIDGRYGQPPCAVLLTVCDTGPGIPAAHLSRIFEPGFSTRTEAPSEAPSATRPSYSGPVRPSGLGLAIVRRLVEEAGGEIRAFSSRGLGARFEIELPLSIPPSPPSPEASIATGRLLVLNETVQAREAL